MGGYFLENNILRVRNNRIINSLNTKFFWIHFKHISHHFSVVPQFLWLYLGFTINCEIRTILVRIYFFKVNNGTTRTMCETGSKLTIKAIEQHSHRSDVSQTCSSVINIEFKCALRVSISVFSTFFEFLMCNMSMWFCNWHLTIVERWWWLDRLTTVR